MSKSATTVADSKTATGTANGTPAAADLTHIGDNVAVAVDGDVLIIRVDLAKRFGKSASGKTIKIASTNGNQGIKHSSGAVIGLNIYTKDGLEPQS